MAYGCFVGLCGFDLVFYQNGLPREDTKSQTDDYHTFIGGPPANAAVTYSMLGGSALLISAIGDSLIGKTIKETLSTEYGIKVIDVFEGSKTLPSMSGIAINELNGSRTIWNGRHDTDGSFIHSYREYLDNMQFCLSDCNIPNVTKDVMTDMAAAHVPIILDAGSWKKDMAFFLSMADTAIASEVCLPPDGSDFLTVAKKAGIAKRAVTKGSAPLLWETDKNAGSIQPPKTDAVDTLAAGDIFHGAYCYFTYEKKLPFTESLKMASEVAAYSTRYKGPRKGVAEYCISKYQQHPQKPNASPGRSS